MRYLLRAGLAAVVILAGSPVSAEDPRPVLDSDEARISYSVGYQMGGDFRKQELTIHPEAFLQGVQDALEGTEPLLPREEMGNILVELKERVVAIQRKQRMVLAETNLQEGLAFLETNRSREGVVSLPSGLQYRIITQGTGAKPRPTDTVTVHYRGTLIDGTEFDSSYSRNEPATFQANQVIKGWYEALQMMPEGSRWELFIPPDLAYGTRGAGARIGPNSTLIFEVDLLEVKQD